MLRTRSLSEYLVSVRPTMTSPTRTDEHGSPAALSLDEFMAACMPGYTGSRQLVHRWEHGQIAPEWVMPIVRAIRPPRSVVAGELAERLATTIEDVYARAESACCDAVQCDALARVIGLKSTDPREDMMEWVDIVSGRKAA